MTTTETPPGPGTAKVAAHPRIRARRIEIKRDEGRRRRHRLMILAAALALIAALAGLTRSPVLDVDRLVVTGAIHTGRDAALDRADLRPGHAMFDVDGPAIADRLERLPWVEKASVQRRWPGTVRVRVTERVPVAQVAAGRRVAVVDRGGHVLEERASPLPSLVRLQGPVAGAPGTRLARSSAPLLSVAATLSTRGSAQVESVVGLGTELVLVLRGGATVRFGPASQLEPKLYALDAMLAREKVGCLATLDVRVPSAPVLTRKFGCA